MEKTILTPVLALAAWTLLMWIWMYIKRIPAMQKANIKPQDARFPGSLSTLSDTTRAAADNYNHLHEQPTVFYALMFYSHLVGIADPLNITLAWAYVALRIAHSLVQVSVNIVMIRFSLFLVSAITLLIITGRNLLALV